MVRLVAELAAALDLLSKTGASGSTGADQPEAVVSGRLRARQGTPGPRYSLIASMSQRAR